MDYGGELLGGGALALLLIREVLNFLKSKKYENGKDLRAGDQTVEAWKQNAAIIVKHEVPILVSQVIKQETMPLLTTQIAILNELQKSTLSMSNNLTLLTRITEMELGEIKEIQEAVRTEGDTTRHVIRDQSKEVVQNLQRNIDQIKKP